ncbi:MAG: hypothetical protein ACR2IS_01845 [Nitrososphaeraceae archaeon]
MEVEKKDFYDKLSEKLYYEAGTKLKNLSQSHYSRVMIELGTFNIAQSYVTSKIENRHGDVVNVNIEGGRCGIELQDTLFDLKDKNLSHAYLITDVKQDLTGAGSGSASAESNRNRPSSTAWRQQHNTITKVLVRRLPILGIKDWLLIYEDTLFLLAVKDAYEEMEIIAFSNE